MVFSAPMLDSACTTASSLPAFTDVYTLALPAPADFAEDADDARDHTAVTGPANPAPVSPPPEMPMTLASTRVVPLFCSSVFSSRSGALGMTTVQSRLAPLPSCRDRL